MAFKEVKHKLDGREQVFECDLLFRTDDAVIVRFQATEEPYKSIADHSEGYFWTDRPYLMYKMFREDDSLVGYRFDVCKDVRIGEDRVDWSDLVLDVRVSPLGEVVVEDEDEVAAAIAAGQLSERDHAAIISTRRLLQTNFASVIRDAERLRERISR